MAWWDRLRMLGQERGKLELSDMEKTLYNIPAQMFEIDTQPRKLTKAEKAQDSQLMRRVLQKYPELRYVGKPTGEEVENYMDNVHPAVLFVDKQKHFLNKGYSEKKSFELTERIFKRKFEEEKKNANLLSGMVMSNKARSYLDWYQQHAEYESRLKVKRLERELPKYQRSRKEFLKFLDNIESTDELDKFDVKGSSRPETWESISAKIVSYHQRVNKTSKTELEDEFIERTEKAFKMYKDRINAEDGLRALNDTGIENRLREAPTKLKRHAKKLLKKLNKLGVSLDAHGEVDYSSVTDPFTLKKLKEHHQMVKITLLQADLEFEYPHKLLAMKKRSSGGAAEFLFKPKKSSEEIDGSGLDSEVQEEISRILLLLRKPELEEIKLLKSQNLIGTSEVELFNRLITQDRVDFSDKQLNEYLDKISANFNTLKEKQNLTASEEVEFKICQRAENIKEGIEMLARLQKDEGYQASIEEKYSLENIANAFYSSPLGETTVGEIVKSAEPSNKTSALSQLSQAAGLSEMLTQFSNEIDDEFRTLIAETLGVNKNISIDQLKRELDEVTKLADSSLTTSVLSLAVNGQLETYYKASLIKSKVLNTDVMEKSAAEQAEEEQLAERLAELLSTTSLSDQMGNGPEGAHQNHPFRGDIFEEMRRKHFLIRDPRFVDYLEETVGDNIFNYDEEELKFKYFESASERERRLQRLWKRVYHFNKTESVDARSLQEQIRAQKRAVEKLREVRWNIDQDLKKHEDAVTFEKHEELLGDEEFFVDSEIRFDKLKRYLKLPPSILRKNDIAKKEHDQINKMISQHIIDDNSYNPYRDQAKSGAYIDTSKFDFSESEADEPDYAGKIDAETMKEVENYETGKTGK